MDHFFCFSVFFVCFLYDIKNMQSHQNPLFVRFHETLEEFAKAFVRLGTETSTDEGHKLQCVQIDDLKQEILRLQLTCSAVAEEKQKFMMEKETHFKTQESMHNDSLRKTEDALHKTEDTLHKTEDALHKTEDALHKTQETLYKTEQQLIHYKYQLENHQDVQRQLLEQKELLDSTQREHRSQQEKHDKQFEYILDVAKTKAKEEEANKYIEKVAELSTKLACMTESREHTEKELLAIKLKLEQQMLLKADESKDTRLLPSIQGAQGEAATKTKLQEAFGNWIVVEDVSKLGQGKEMDLKLTTHYDDIVVRIDCKNYLYSTQLPEKEVLRFNSDMDSLAGQKSIQADACILFTTHLCKGNVQYTKDKRGRLYRFHVGGWNFPALIEAIHESISLVRHDRFMNAKSDDTQHVPKTPGGKELKSMIHGMLECLHHQNASLASIGTQVHQCVGKSATRSRLINGSIQAAHTANPEVVTETMMKEFELHLPKQARGRPMALTKKGKTKSATDTLSKNNVTDTLSKNKATDTLSKKRKTNALADSSISVKKSKT